MSHLVIRLGERAILLWIKIGQIPRHQHVVNGALICLVGCILLSKPLQESIGVNHVRVVRCIDDKSPVTELDIDWRRLVGTKNETRDVVDRVHRYEFLVHVTFDVGHKIFYLLVVVKTSRRLGFVDYD